MRRPLWRLLLLMSQAYVALSGGRCALTCLTPGFAMDTARCACERMRCAPRQRLIHAAGRVFCGPDLSACPPCAEGALEAMGCACVNVQPCPNGGQWWRDARDAFVCRASSF